MAFEYPGIRSRLPWILGAQKLWITSAELVSNTTGTPTGTWISFAVVTVKSACGFGYCTSHHHWCPTTLMLTGFFDTSEFMFLPMTTEYPRIENRMITLRTVAA